MSEYLKFGQFLFLLDLLPGGRALLPPPSPPCRTLTPSLRAGLSNGCLQWKFLIKSFFSFLDKLCLFYLHNIFSQMCVFFIILRKQIFFLWIKSLIVVLIYITSLYISLSLIHCSTINQKYKFWCPFYF